MRTEITEDGERPAHYWDNYSLAGTIAQQLAPAVLDNREKYRVTRTHYRNESESYLHVQHIL